MKKEKDKVRASTKRSKAGKTDKKGFFGRLFLEKYAIYTVIVLSIVGLGLRLAFIDTSYVMWDEAVYLMDAQKLASYHAPYDEVIFRPPLLSLMLSGLSAFGDELVSRLLIVLMNSFFVLGAYLLGRECSHKAGLIAACAAAFFPFHVLASGWIMTDLLAALLLLFSFYLHHKGYQESRPKSDGGRKDFGMFLVFLGGLCFGLSVMMKFSSLFFLGILGLFYLIHIRKLRLHLLSLGGAFYGVIPVLMIGYFLMGDPIGMFSAAFEAVDVADSPGFLQAAMYAAAFGGLLWIFAILSAAGAFGNLLKAVFWKGAQGYDGRFPADRLSSSTGPYLKILMAAWLMLGLGAFFWVLGKGVAKPEFISWEPQRFLFPIMAPLVVLAAIWLAKLKLRFALPVIVLSVIVCIPAYDGLFAPAISLEHGLRKVSYDMGMYLKENDFHGERILCIAADGNCPPVAYYSAKKIEIVWDVEASEMSGQGYVIYFSRDGCGEGETGFTEGGSSCCLSKIE